MKGNFLFSGSRDNAIKKWDFSKCRIEQVRYLSIPRSFLKFLGVFWLFLDFLFFFIVCLVFFTRVYKTVVEIVVQLIRTRIVGSLNPCFRLVYEFSIWSIPIDISAISLYFLQFQALSPILTNQNATVIFFFFVVFNFLLKS